MKICAFTDVHGDTDAVDTLKNVARDADLLVSSGDFSVFGNNLHSVMHELDTIGKPVITIHGNHETHEALCDVTETTDNITALHKDHHSLDDILFLGYGGGGFAHEYDDFHSVASQFHNVLSDRPSVLLIHGPPYKTNLDKVRDNHVGNVTMRDFIDDASPNVVVCGHLHENFGTYDVIDGTYIVNPGPHGRIITVDE